METALVWFVGILASTVITILINDPLKFMIARGFGGYSSAARSLRGIWKGDYDYVSEGVEKSEEHYFRVKQIGKYVVARTLSDGQAYYKLRGKLDQQSFLTGLWEERTPDGRFYHGAFQLTLGPQGNHMNGRWIGYNRHYVVMGGAWRFKREATAPTRQALEQYRQHHGWPVAGTKSMHQAEKQLSS